MNNTYEILFIFDPTFGASWEKAEAEIKRLMDRAEAEVIFTKRLEERRLAFEIKGRKRGLYAITYFTASGTKIPALERDARLSEAILRVLVLRADGVPLDKMKAVTLGGEGYRGRGEYDDRPDYRGEGGEPAYSRGDRGSMISNAADVGPDSTEE